jgi:hypothetical protein
MRECFYSLRCEGEAVEAAVAVAAAVRCGRRGTTSQTATRAMSGPRATSSRWTLVRVCRDGAVL